MAPKERTRFDRRDLAILAALQRDGRMTNQALAALVALAPSAALRRRRALERTGAIKGYRAEIAIGRVAPGIEIYAELRLARHAPTDFARVETLLARTPAIVEAVQLGGEADYLIRAFVPDLEAWRKVNDDLVAACEAAVTVKSRVTLKSVKPFAGYPLPSG
jgi:DNA-binding Lrp family transcriptional regulator